MAHDVFISYSSTDQTIANAVVAGLEQRGIRCWIAPRDLRPGIPWGQGIADAIEASKVMVVIISEKANQSKQVGREVERAISKDVAVIPFRIQNITPTGAIAYFLSSEHWLDAISPPIERHIEKLCNVIKAFISETSDIGDSSSVIGVQELETSTVETPKPTFLSIKKHIAVIIGILAAVFVCFVIVLIGILVIFPLRPEPTSTPTATSTLTPSMTLSPTFTQSLEITPTLTEMPTSTETPISGSVVEGFVSMVNPVDGAVMVNVPAGEFIMGSEDEEAYEDEGPERVIFLDAFWLYKIPVTNTQFELFTQSTGHQTTAEIIGFGFVFDFFEDDYTLIDGVYWRSPEGPGSNIVGREDHPVVHVSWRDALAYCEWAGGRLPTEAEWEKGARGEDGRTYPWGNNAPTKRLANYDGFITTPAGSFLDGISPYGALDMAGNVWEWVSDWYEREYYSRSPSSNPPGPTSGEDRVVRGGSFFFSANALRTYTRYWEDPTLPDNGIGFRCVVSGR